MKTLEIIFAVQRPVSVYFVIASRGELQTGGFEDFEPGGRVIDKLLERRTRIDRRKREAAANGEWDLREIVGFGRKVLDTRELRHRQKLSAQIEPTSVIPAADQVRFARLFD